MFRNESKEVVRKAKAKKVQATKARKGSGICATKHNNIFAPVDEIEPTSDDSLQIARWGEATCNQILPSALTFPVEELATGFFFTNYVIGVNGPT